MNELMNTSSGSNIRWRLLATVSAITLLSVISVGEDAHAAGESDQPTVWIEIGGQLERVDGGQAPFAPPFTLITPTPAPYKEGSPLIAQRPPRFSFGGEAKIVFEPEGTDWVLSAAVRYGRSNGKRHVRQQTDLPNNITFGTRVFPYPGQQFADTKTNNLGGDTVVDFQVGKDVGLGMLGHEGSAVLTAGVRFAQIQQHSHIEMKARPEWVFLETFGFLIDASYHSYAANVDISRNFHGVGPSISWNAATPIAGSDEHGEVLFDWGLNAAVLFGRQKMSEQHHTSSQYYHRFNFTKTIYPVKSGSHSRSRSVTVPNVGGFAGLAYRVENFKMGLGYRADFFFGAIDGGIDARKTYDRDFYGPFATISIGLGG
jgi:hypothetical protein